MNFKNSISINTATSIFYNAALIFTMLQRPRDGLIFIGVLILIGGLHILTLFVTIISYSVKEKPLNLIAYSLVVVFVIYLITWIVIAKLF